MDWKSVVLASFNFRKETGAVEVDVGVEEFVAERVDRVGETLRNMAVTQVFAHDGAVLGFGQAIVIAAPGPGFSELHA